ncbi:MAG: sugar ABC transporter ATP-binding protein [Ilumatobacteraceae bacterium]|nr:sugar ABC transporter ATP-binding protein [Ilumatobacteraceae bacterium]
MTMNTDIDVAADEVHDEVVLSCEQIAKVFPGTVALRDVDFRVRRGKVNVLVGENGAGKSTLMKIVAGVQGPTSGQLLMDGEPIELHSTRDAEDHGIGIVYQELNLCANLTVADNIYLGREITRRGGIDRSAQRDGAREIIQRLGHDIDPDMLVGDLRIGQQQVVEIAKALTHEVRVLIMDEPTSALSAAEVEELFGVIRDLTTAGVAIVYISHRLEELIEIGDYITVLRDGQLVDESKIDAVDVPWIIRKMVGKDPAELFEGHGGEVGEERLRVEDLCLIRNGGYVVDHVSFSVHAGEVVGIYGLMGAGRSELFECLAGRHRDATGDVYLSGELLESSTVLDRIKAGIILAPEDRQRDGLVQPLSVADNMVLASLEDHLGDVVPALRTSSQREAVAEQIASLGIRVASPNQLITSLSGGNQQKVVLAKALLTSPRVLLLDEPSRGIDVNAKAEIFALMAKMASEGFGVVFVSSELKEVLAMSDRILVMSKGRLTATLHRSEATEEALVAASAAGHRPTDKGETIR